MNEREAALKVKRPDRTPLGARNKLTVDGLKDTKEFVYRFIGDKNGKLEACYAAGWEFVSKKGEVIGDVNVETGKGVGSVHTIPGGGGVKLYLMKIPRDVWLYDRQSRVDVPTDELEQAQMSVSANKSKGLNHGSIKAGSTVGRVPEPIEE